MLPKAIAGFFVAEERSAHYLETVHWTFSCPHQRRDPAVRNLEPWEISELLRGSRSGGMGLGFNNECE